MTYPPELISEIEAAKRLGLAQKTLQRRRWKGDPPSFFKLGTRVLYRVEDLEAFIEGGRVAR